MSPTLWEVPVAERAEVAFSRRLLRSVPTPLPRDARPSRARHERPPAQVRAWGASSRIRETVVE